MDDAQTLNEQNVVEAGRGTLIRTPSVRKFLDEDNIVSRAIVAPKGFGKTFVLKLMRMALVDAGYQCFPHGKIVDRPGPPIPLLKYEALALLTSSYNWEALWQIAFVVSILKGLNEQPSAFRVLARARSQASNADWKRILELDAEQATPFAIVQRLIDVATLPDVLRDGANLINSFSGVHTQAALFVDNIDEYLDTLVSRKNPGAISRAAPLEAWNNAQVGAWRAIRSLHGINPHVSIFISLRKEAFHHAESTDAQFTNLCAFAVELKYEREDIATIITNNIRAERAVNLAAPKKSNPLERFVGPDAITVQNTGTGQTENILDYWLRHCTGRPRDAVKIGRALSELAVANRSPARIRTVVNAAAATLVGEMFRAADMHLTAFDPKLLSKVITHNAFSRKDIEAKGHEYDQLLRASGVVFGDSAHLFCTLYALGLLGVVYEDAGEPGRRVQRFRPAGWTTLGTHEILPNADTYLIHPALSDYIAQQDLTYLSRINRYNIVGDGREWHQHADFAFVVKGDLKGYRKKVMGKSGPSQTFASFWEKTFSAATEDKISHKKFDRDDDQFVIADPSPTRVLEACRRLAAALKASPFEFELRAGGDAGLWRLRNHQSEEMMITDMVGVAARLETKASPGKLWVSEEFYKGVERRNNKPLLGEFRIPAVHEGSEPFTLNISKENEEEEVMAVYEADLLPAHKT